MKRILIIGLLFSPLVFGYRVYPGGNAWGVTLTDPKLFLKFCANLQPTENDVGSTDPLYNQTLTHQLIVDSIVNDYNSVPGSWLVLSDSATDGSFSSVTHAQRIINVCTGSITGAAGYAQQKMESGVVVGCDITLGSMAQSARGLLRLLTHEIGHCLNLDHPQETKYAVMSYFSNEDVYRLQDDDKAGIRNVFPVDPLTKSPNLGCSGN